MELGDQMVAVEAPEQVASGQEKLKLSFQRDLAVAISCAIRPLHVGILQTYEEEKYHPLTQERIKEACDRVPTIKEIQDFIVDRWDERAKGLVDIDWDASVGIDPEGWEFLKEQQFGQVVRVFRERAGLGIDDIAAKSRFVKKRNTQCSIEGNLVVPRGEALLDLINVLGLDIGAKPANLLFLKSIQSRETVGLYIPKAA